MDRVALAARLFDEWVQQQETTTDRERPSTTEKPDPPSSADEHHKASSKSTETTTAHAADHGATTPRPLSNLNQQALAKTSLEKLKARGLVLAPTAHAPDRPDAKSQPSAVKHHKPSPKSTETTTVNAADKSSSKGTKTTTDHATSLGATAPHPVSNLNPQALPNTVIEAMESPKIVTLVVAMLVVVLAALTGIVAALAVVAIAMVMMGT